MENKNFDVDFDLCAAIGRAKMAYSEAEDLWNDTGSNDAWNDMKNLGELVACLEKANSIAAIYIAEGVL